MIRLASLCANLPNRSLAQPQRIGALSRIAVIRSAQDAANLPNGSFRENGLLDFATVECRQWAVMMLHKSTCNIKAIGAGLRNLRGLPSIQGHRCCLMPTRHDARAHLEQIRQPSSKSWLQTAPIALFRLGQPLKRLAQRFYQPRVQQNSWIRNIRRVKTT